MGIAIQEGIWEEEVGHLWLLIAPVGHWQHVFTDMLEGHTVLIMPDHKGFQSAACNTAPK